MQALEDTTLAVTEALVALSAADLPYSDLYLHRAEALLGSLLSRDRYVALRRERDGLPGLAKELRHLAEIGDWQHVRDVAHEGASRAQRVGASERLLILGDSVYGPRALHAEASALALSGMTVQPPSHLGRIRAECVGHLRLALAQDAAGAELYRMRLAYLDQLEIVADEPTARPGSTDGLQDRILHAADKGDFQEADRLSAEILELASRNAPARLRTLHAVDGRRPMLAASFSESTLRRAGDLGLAAVTLEADDAIRAYCDVLRSAVTSGSAPERAPTLSSDLQESLDLLIGRPFVTSAGSRYLPSFAAETILAETFPEAEPATRTGLLDALALPSRRAVSRLAIEDAVRRHGRTLCVDLGLDPLHFAVVPIPFDAYVRLAERFDWGRHHLWTHFDGYQLTSPLHLRALVGGDARYGGRSDLCSVSRDYAIERLLARFAVVRRARLTLHAPQCA